MPLKGYFSLVTYIHVPLQFYVQDGGKALSLYALDKCVSYNTKKIMNIKCSELLNPYNSSDLQTFSTSR